MNSRTTVCSLVLVVMSFVLAETQSASASQIGLSVTQSAPVVISGAKVNVNATVTNTDDSPQSGNLNFDVAYQDWDSETNIGHDGDGAGTLPPGNSQSFPFQGNTTGATLGTNGYSVKVSSNVATNSPQNYNGSVFVLAHSAPQIFSYVLNKYILIPPPATAPPADPLAFGATGGGESVAVPLGLANRDPPEPTAGMAMNFFSESGSSKITSTLAPFDNLAAIAADNQNPNDGLVFQILCQNNEPGTFSKTFTLYFSDEQDLPGANLPGSFVAEVSCTFQIYPDGSSQYAINLVPEPTSMVMLATGMIAACGMIRFKRNRLPQQS